jgi:hypothetical protein
MLMGDVFTACAPHGGFAKQDQLGQTFVLDRIYPALRVGIQIRTPGRQSDGFDTTGFDDLTKRSCELGIAIMASGAGVLEASPFIQGDVAGDLLHPPFIGMRRYTCDFDLATRQAYEEKHRVRD